MAPCFFLCLVSLILQTHGVVTVDSDNTNVARHDLEKGDQVLYYVNTTYVVPADVLGLMYVNDKSYDYNFSNMSL